MPWPRPPGPVEGVVWDASVTFSSLSGLYLLSEAGDPAVRYVGCTCGLKQRVQTHISTAWQRRSKKERWVHDLLARGGKILVRYVGRGDFADERRLIRDLLAAGEPLVNTVPTAGQSQHLHGKKARP